MSKIMELADTYATHMVHSHYHPLLEARADLQAEVEKIEWLATATHIVMAERDGLREKLEALSQPVSMEPWSYAGAMPPEQEEVKKAAYQLAPWLSAALDDPNVCKEYKDAINAWFDAAMPAAPEQRIAELEQKNTQLLEALKELYEGCIGFMSEDNSDMTKARAAIAEVKP